VLTGENCSPLGLEGGRVWEKALLFGVFLINCKYTHKEDGLWGGGADKKYTMCGYFVSAGAVYFNQPLFFFESGTDH